MVMTTYKEREEELFARWIEACIVSDRINPEEDFAYDGLLFRGEYELIGGCCWERLPGNETELWDNSRCRLLILTKDTTLSGGMQDMRIETARRNHIGHQIATSPARFYRNLSLWAYTLQAALRGNEIVAYDQTPDWDTLREHYTSAPIARINCKKEIGSSTISNATLRSHIERYGEFLAEQVAMYDADIVLCCGGGGAIRSFIERHYLPDLERFSPAGWVYYSPSTRKVVIDSYHPSYTGQSIEAMYTNMAEDLGRFLQQHPEYLRSEAR